MANAILDGTGSGYTAKVDKFNQLKASSIDFSHNQIHEGNHYYINGFSTLNSGNELYFGINTTNKFIHMFFDIEGTTQTEVYEYESPTLSGGIVGSVFNNNRASTNTSSIIVTMNPTISGASPTSGTLIYSQSRGVGGTNPANARFIGKSNREDEIILKKDNTYLWRIKSAVNNNIIDYEGFWYEI